jgi:RNA polymerase sigma factor (sigma-70 family)
MKTAAKKQTGLRMPPEASKYERAQEGCRESLNQLMKRHEPLVLYAVKRQNLGDIPYEEAVQAGRIGLWQAILKYEAGRGNRFSTYAYPAIVHQVWAAVKDHCVANGKQHGTREWVIFFRHWEVGPAETQAQEEVRESLYAMVKRLPEMMQQVIRVRYEMGGRKWRTYEEIGTALGFSGEWVRQLEIQAMVWLRHPAHSQEVRELLQRHSQQEYEWAEEIAQTWLRRRGGRHG